MSARIVYEVDEPLGSMLASCSESMGGTLAEWVEWMCWVKYQARPRDV